MYNGEAIWRPAMTLKRILNIADDAGHLEEILRPSQATDLGNLDEIFSVALDLRDSLSDNIAKQLPERKRAAEIHAKNIGKYGMNMFLLRYIPDRQTEPVWRVFVNPSYEIASGAEFKQDPNWSHYALEIRTDLTPPDAIVVKADMVFDLPSDLKSNDINHDTIQRNYSETLQETMVFVERYGKYMTSGNAFLAKIMCDLSAGRLPIDDVPREELEAFVRNSGQGYKDGQTILTDRDHRKYVLRITNPDVLNKAASTISDGTKKALERFLELRAQHPLPQASPHAKPQNTL